MDGKGKRKPKPKRKHTPKNLSERPLTGHIAGEEVTISAFWEDGQVFVSVTSTDGVDVVQAPRKEGAV